jgi:hypothetical protein
MAELDSVYSFQKPYTSNPISPVDYQYPMQVPPEQAAVVALVALAQPAPNETSAAELG